MEIWSNTDKHIQQHNERHAAGLETYQQAHTQFSDMTLAEKQKYLGATNNRGHHGGKRNIVVKPQKKTTKPPKTTKPQPTAAVDWRTVPGTNIYPIILFYYSSF